MLIVGIINVPRSTLHLIIIVANAIGAFCAFITLLSTFMLGGGGEGAGGATLLMIVRLGDTLKD